MFVGILTFISMINTTTKRLKARNFFVCREQLKFRAQLSVKKSFITARPGGISFMPPKKHSLLLKPGPLVSIRAVSETCLTMVWVILRKGL